MPKAIPIISALHNLSAGDLADEHGQLCAQIADLETRKRTIAGELIRRGVSEVEGLLDHRCGPGACKGSGLGKVTYGWIQPFIWPLYRIQAFREGIENPLAIRLGRPTILSLGDLLAFGISDRLE